MTSRDILAALAADRRDLEANGFRIYLSAGYLNVQDLLEGRWARFLVRHRRSRGGQSDGGLVLADGRREISKSYLYELLSSWFDQFGDDDFIDVGELASVLLTGDDSVPKEVADLIPTPQSLATETVPWWRTVDWDAISEHLMVVTAVAHLGGSTDEEELVENLSALDIGTADARRMIRRAREAGAVIVERGRGIPCVRLTKRFDLDWMAPPKPSTESREMAALFEDDGDV